MNSHNDKVKFGNIKGEAESIIVAGQDKAVTTNYFKNKNLKEETDSKFQLRKNRRN
jgi:hypothetical protein